MTCGQFVLRGVKYMSVFKVHKKMNAMKFLFCLLPVIVHANITINIQASKDTTDASLQVTGFSQSVITAKDAEVFQLTEETLKKAILNITGRAPTDVFLHGPTPWNDLYKTYGWQPVMTIVKPHRIRVIDVKTSEVVLNVRNIYNEDSVAKKEKVSLTARVENKVTSLWKQRDSFAAEIDYNVNIITVGSNFKFNSTFGENINEIKTTTTKSPSVEFVLQPKEYVSIVFKGTKVNVLVEIEYWVVFNGYVATNNEVKLNGHHFWAYDVNRVMEAVSVNNLRKSKEIVNVEFITDGGTSIELNNP